MLITADPNVGISSLPYDFTRFVVSFLLASSSFSLSRLCLTSPLSYPIPSFLSHVSRVMECHFPSSRVVLLNLASSYVVFSHHVVSHIIAPCHPPVSPSISQSKSFSRMTLSALDLYFKTLSVRLITISMPRTADGLT